MSYWNFRVIEFNKYGESWRAIHEVHYEDDGTLTGYCESPVEMISFDESELNPGLSWMMDKMHEALGKPVLKESDFYSEKKVNSTKMHGDCPQRKQKSLRRRN